MGKRLESLFQTVFDVGHTIETLCCIAIGADRTGNLSQFLSCLAILGRS
jgi:hypothetical protein